MFYEAIITLHPESGPVRVRITDTPRGTVTIDAAGHWSLPELPAAQARNLGEFLIGAAREANRTASREAKE